MRQSLLMANLLALLGLVAVMIATAGFGWRPIQAEEAPKPPTEPQKEPQKSRPKIAVFNMAMVMKDFGKAKYLVKKLNKEKSKLSPDQLNSKSAEIITSLHDDIKKVVDKTAEMNGYDIVFAYPDATSPEEANTPYVMELKLKPPAAQPFYVAKQVDLTSIIIKTLNTWYPAPGQNPPREGVEFFF